MYETIDENLYENRFLQKLLANSPAHDKVINLKKNKITINLQDQLIDMISAENQMKQKQIEKI